MIVQVGSKGNALSAEESREILKEYFDSWNDRNPNLELIGAYYHADEKGEPHVHFDYVPVADYEKGMSRRTGLNKALEAQGFEKKGKATPQIQWERAENDYLERLCRDRGHEVEHPERDKSPEQKREHEETRIYQANRDLDKREKEVSAKEREQARKGRALDKQEKDLAESRKSLDKDIKTAEAERDKVDAIKSQIRADRAVIEQTREAADRIQNIRPAEKMEMPEPISKGFHKGYYTVEQVRELTNAVNQAREATRNIEKYREVSSLDERLEQASRQANQNIKDKTIDRLKEENERLKTYEKDHDFCVWLDKNYDMRDFKKDFEREQKEHERSREHTHDRNSPER